MEAVKWVRACNERMQGKSNLKLYADPRCNWLLHFERMR